MAVHNFTSKLKQGQEVEAMLDDYLFPSYAIRPASRAEQRQGIDRWLTDRELGGEFAIDYKADWRAADTGNAFIETVSVDTVGKPGWALASRADFILYYIPQTHRLYWLSMAEIRAALPGWLEIYPSVPVKNAEYKTFGVIVPLSRIVDIAEAIVELDE